MHDLRDSIRSLASSRGFTIAAVLSIAIAIGANTTIFSLVKAVLLDPLPINAHTEVMAVFRTFQPANAAEAGAAPDLLPTSFPNYEDLADGLQTMAGLAAFSFGQFNVASDADPVQAFGQYVTGNFFELLGIEPLRGRFIEVGDAANRGAGSVVVLSEGLWRRQYGSDTDIVGSTIRLNGRPFTVVGITPVGFTGLQALFATELWVPVSMFPVLQTGLAQTALDQRAFRYFSVFGRLATGATEEQAQTELSARAERLAEDYPAVNSQRGVQVMPVAEAALGPSQRALVVRSGVIMMGAVGMVLLIACANLSNLMLVRARRRRRDHALRVALGAGRLRLARLQLTESMLVTVAGGALGAALAVWSRDLIWSLRPPLLENAVLDLSFDLRLAAFVSVVTIATGLIFGLAPAVQAMRADLTSALRSRDHEAGRLRWLDLRQALVATQVALCVVALSVAGAFFASLQAARAITPGYDAARLLTMRFDAGAQGRGEAETLQFYDDALTRLSGLPGVDAVTVAATGPLSGGAAYRMFGDDADLGPNGTYLEFNVVGPSYFETLGVETLEGRTFDSRDDADGQTVIVVNQTLAKRYWAGESAIGRRLRIGPPIDTVLEIVGVVADVKYGSLGEEPKPYLYRPLAQEFAGNVALYLRATGDPEALIDPARRALREVDPALPISAGRSVGDLIDESLWAPLLGASLLGLFGVVAAVLAVTGIYAVITQTLTQRSHEIGVRMALGARPGSMATFIARKGLAPVLIGLGLGMLAGVFALPSLSVVLHGSTSWLTTIVPAAGLIALAALTACVVPARRAMRIDPLRALRTE